MLFSLHAPSCRHLLLLSLTLLPLYATCCFFLRSSLFSESYLLVLFFFWSLLASSLPVAILSFLCSAHILVRFLLRRRIRGLSRCWEYVQRLWLRQIEKIPPSTLQLKAMMFSAAIWWIWAWVPRRRCFLFFARVLSWVLVVWIRKICIVVPLFMACPPLIC